MLGRKKKVFGFLFSWLEAFYSKAGESDKGGDILQLYEKSLQLVQKEEEKCV